MKVHWQIFISNSIVAIEFSFRCQLPFSGTFPTQLCTKLWNRKGLTSDWILLFLVTVSILSNNFISSDSFAMTSYSVATFLEESAQLPQNRQFHY